MSTYDGRSAGQAQWDPDDYDDDSFSDLSSLPTDDEDDRQDMDYEPQVMEQLPHSTCALRRRRPSLALR